jgi:hypothetical protein
MVSPEWDGITVLRPSLWRMTTSNSHDGEATLRQRRQQFGAGDAWAPTHAAMVIR